MKNTQKIIILLKNNDKRYACHCKYVDLGNVLQS